MYNLRGKSLKQRIFSLIKHILVFQKKVLEFISSPLIVELAAQSNEMMIVVYNWIESMIVNNLNQKADSYLAYIPK